MDASQGKPRTVLRPELDDPKQTVLVACAKLEDPEVSRTLRLRRSSELTWIVRTATTASRPFRALMGHGRPRGSRRRCRARQVAMRDTGSMPPAGFEPALPP